MGVGGVEGVAGIGDQITEIRIRDRTTTTMAIKGVAAAVGITEPAEEPYKPKTCKTGAPKPDRLARSRRVRWNRSRM